MSEFNWMTPFRDIRSDLLRDALQIENVATAMKTLGLPAATTLREVADDLWRAADELDVAIGAKLDEDLRITRESTATMLKAALAGAALAEAKQEDHNAE